MSARTLTIRLDREGAAVLDAYMERYEVATASKAMREALSRAMTLDDALAESREAEADLRDRLEVKTSVLESARYAAAQLIEIAGQSDITD